jgi:hypothetical protein
VSVAVVAACGGPPAGYDGTIGGVTVSPATATISVDATVQLNATLTGVTGNPNRSITWTSGAESIAKVSSSGLVTGEAAGTAVITATSVFDATKSGIATVTVTAGGDPDPDPDPTTFGRLVVATGSALQILSTAGSLDQLERGTAMTTASSATQPFIPCGPAAAGPGGRLYVASLTSGGAGGGNTSSILVFDLAALEGGPRAPVAVLVAPSRFNNVCGVAFDEDGTLWTVNNNQAFSDPDTHPRTEAIGLSGVSGSESGTVVATVGSAFDVAPATGFENPVVYDLRVDAQNRLWLLDQQLSALLRYDDVTNLPAGKTPVDPDLRLTVDVFAAPPAFSGSQSMAVDANGNVYVAGPSDGAAAHVSRFDGLGAESGEIADAVPDARFKVQGIAAVSLVALDAQGALWVGGSTDVARVTAPTSAADGAELVPTRLTPYRNPDVDVPNGTGGMTFVPVPSGLGF